MRKKKNAAFNFDCQLEIQTHLEEEHACMARGLVNSGALKWESLPTLCGTIP